MEWLLTSEENAAESEQKLYFSITKIASKNNRTRSKLRQVVCLFKCP